MKVEDVRKYMEKSIEVMKESIQEVRADAKPSPFVGAVLVRKDGSMVTAYRGELREGDHAEFTLIERKCRAEKLDGCTLFATLEPCAPGARHFPKLGCSERIVNARIRKVYIGIEDLDPTVCRKGIQFLIDNGVEVEMYPQDLQEEISDCNKVFLSAATERARLVEEREEIILSKKENVENQAILDDLSEKLLSSFVQKADLGVEWGDKNCSRVLSHLGLLNLSENVYKPTGIGLLLFGNSPQLCYPNARVKALYVHPNGEEDIRDFTGPLVSQPEDVLKWVKDRLDKWIDRARAERKTVYSYPIEVVNELVKNAIVHRDYDIEGAPIYVEINKDAIIIKSPGLPVAPLNMEQMKSFKAPSLSRNPKMMYVFDVMGLAEQRGLGFKTVRKLPDEYDIPLPIVSYEEPYMVMTLPLSSESGVFGGSKTLEIKVADYLRLNPGSSRKEVESYLGIETRKAERLIKALIEKDVVRKEGAGKSSVYFVK